MSQNSLLTVEEFIEIFKDIFSMNYTKSEFTKCKPEFVQRVYTLFLKDFGASIEKLSIIPFNAPGCVHTNPDMYRSTIFILFLSKSVKHFLGLIADNDEFTPMDLFNPVWIRTRKFFSIFTNFYLYICRNISGYEEVESQLEHKQKMFDDKLEKVEALKEEIRKREMQNAECQILLEKNTKALSLEKEEIEKAQDLKVRLKGRLEGVKKEIFSLVTKIKEMELLILEGKETIDSLKKQVMEEDEILEVKAGEERVAFHKATNDELKANLKEMKRNLQLQEKSEEYLKTNLMPLAKEIQIEITKEKELISEQKEVERVVASLYEKNEELNGNIQTMIETLSNLEEERTQLKNSRSIRKLGLEEEISQLKLTVEGLRRRNEEHEIVDRDLDAEIYEYETKTKTVLEEEQQLLFRAKDFLNRIWSELDKRIENDGENFQEAADDLLSNL